MNPVASDGLNAASRVLHTRRVHTITDRFSMANTYLIVEERLVVVDPVSEGNVRQLEGYLQRFLQRPLSDIDLIVLTRPQPGHAAGIAALRQLCHAPVAVSAAGGQPAHRDAGEKRESLPPGTQYHLFGSTYERRIAAVDLWLDDGASLPGHAEWRVLALPRHLTQSLSLYNPFTQELLCGETLITIRNGIPLLRGVRYRWQLEEMLHILRSLRIHYLYPGHGRAILSLNPLRKIDIE